MALLRRIRATADVWVPVLIAVLLLAISWSVAASETRSIGARMRSDAYSRAGQIAANYQNDVSTTIKLVDNILRFIADYAAENGTAGTERMVQRGSLYSGILRNVTLADVNGNGMAFTSRGAARVSVKDRHDLQLALHSRELIIGRPFVSHATKQMIVPFVRALRDRNGKPVGVVGSALDVGELSFGFGTSENIGAHGYIDLIGLPDREIRARVTPHGTIVPPDGESPLAPSEGAGSLQSFLRLDSEHGLARVYAYQAVPGYPLAVVSSLAFVDLDASTSELRGIILLRAFAATFVVLLFLAGWLQQQRSRKALRLSREQEAAAKEVALAATQAKSEFLANMSHEIRTPMNGVIGLTHLALMTDLTPKQRDYLTKIEYSAKSLLNIINDILDFSKIEAGKLELEEVLFDLHSVIDNLNAVSAIRAAEKGLTYEVRLDPGVPTELIGDPVRFGQIILNLVTNAIKFTEHGGVVVTIGVKRQGMRDVELETSVSDTGIGMTETEQEHLFESFSQVDASISRRFGGTGLGLAISKALTHRMGGQISVVSQRGKGSTFTFTAVLHRPERRALPRPVESLRDRRVLVVDDDPVARESIASTLHAWSLQVTEARSGADALAAVREARAAGRPFDIVLMDWKMPGQNGIEAAQAIRNDVGDERPPIVILVSAFGRAEVFESAKRAGIESFLVKPIDPSLLLETMQSLLASAAGPASSGTAAKREEAPAEASPEQLRGAHVLIAEDNDINQQIVEHLLQRLGVTVEFASNGREAVDAVFADYTRFDAVLMDVQMPEMDGLEATQLIREALDADTLPIIAMTAHAMEQERQLCLDAGMNDHLTKPVDPKSLTRTLARWVTKKRSSVG